ncbi:microtubule organization protein AKNA [Polymixia lowei]
MEMRENHTTAGVLFWTPAPVRISPATSVASEDGWEDEGEDEKMKMAKEEDFHSQMDENGIIGLKEALQDLEVWENYSDGDGEFDRPWCARALDPEKACSGGLQTALEPSGDLDELQDLSEVQDSETLSHTELPEGDPHTMSIYEDVVQTWMEDEELRQREEGWMRRSMEHFPERDKQLDMTEEENDGEEESTDGKKKRNEHTNAPGSSTTLFGPTNVLAKSHIARQDNGKICCTRTSDADMITLEANGSFMSNCRNRTPVSDACRSSSLSPSSTSNLLRPISRPPSPSRALRHPHLLHFSAEELAHAPGIEAETFPDMGFTESLPESCSSRLSQPPKPHWPRESERVELKPKVSSYPATISPDQGMSYQQNGIGERLGKSTINPRKRPTPSPRKMRHCSHEATSSGNCSLNKSRAASSNSSYEAASPDRGLRTPRGSPFNTQARTVDHEVDEARRGPLSFRTPDFSKVEPKVRFPKSGYKPPKSRGPSKRSVSVERPLVFKSPADIVREVLFSSTEGLPLPPGPTEPQTSAANSTVPEDFRCPQQATTLVEQLQEDYNRLLTKYAEAENTIDRLRLEAKVNLYSDPPKPSHSVQSGVIHEGSKVMTLNFPQAQKAEISSSSVQLDGPGAHQRVSPARSSSVASSSSRRSLGPQQGQMVTRTLSKQAHKFRQQVQTFEDLLKSGKLKPPEQKKGLSQLVQGLDCLERGFLLARDEHRLLQHRGAETGSFDPNRELEGLIFQCGISVEDLKEQVDQAGLDHPVAEAPPSPPPHPAPLSRPNEGREPLPHPESPVLPLPGVSRRTAEGEVSSASEESDGEEAGTEDEEALFLRPLDREHRLAEQDFSMLLDHCQSFKELPILLDRDQREGVPPCPGPGEDVQPDEEGEKGQHRGTGNVEPQNGLPQRRAKSNHQDTPVPATKPGTSKSDPPSPRATDQSPVPPTHLPKGTRRSGVGKSHSSSLTSLGESAVSERRGSKLQPATRRVLSQDGIISPETDSGFVGSESSRLTPAAVPGPLHQRASASVSAPQERSPGNPQARPLSGRPLPSSSSCMSLEHSDGAPGPTQGRPRRPRREERRGTSASSSPRPWVGQTLQTRTGSGTSEFGLDSDHTNTVSEEEDRQNDQYAESTNSQHSYRSGPSPTAPHRHGDSPGALSSGQVTNRNEAIQTLQAEVSRLKERLERSLRQTKPLSPVRVPPSAQGNHSHHKASTPCVRQRRRDSIGEERRESRIADDPEEGCAPRPAPWTRSASSPRRRPEPHFTTDSEYNHSAPRPQLSRPVPVSTAAPGDYCSHSDTVRSRGTPTRQHPGCPAGASEPVDEPDRTGSQAPACPQCSSHRHGRPARPRGGDTEPIHASSRSCHCPLCGQPEPCRNTNTEPVSRREREPGPAHRSSQPAQSPDRGVRATYLAMPGPPVLGSVPLVQCVPVCPPPVLFYSSPVMKIDSHPQPFCVSLGGGGATAADVRGRGEVRGHACRSLSADRRRSLSGSLNRAIQAARDMKHTSRRMARSLSTGLHYQELLSQSCIY